MNPAFQIEHPETLNQLLSEGLSECVITNDGRGDIELTINSNNQNLVWGSFGIIPPDFNIGMLYVNDTETTTLQKLGIGKKVLQNIMTVAQNNHLENLRILATDMGAYVWARAGFVPDNWDSLCRRLLNRLNEIAIPEPEKLALENLISCSNDPKDIWVIADSKFGKALLEGQGYGAQLDLNDKEMVQRFNQYTTLSKSQLQVMETGLNQALGRA